MIATQSKFVLGFTLLEVLVTLSIIILLSALSAPIVSNIEKNRQLAVLRSLYQINQYARSLAINRNQVITLCGTTDGAACTKEWVDASVLVFFDVNDNHVLDIDETLYRNQHFADSLIHWRGSNRNYMRYHPKGYLLDWGRYIYCPNNDSTSAYQLVFNRMGRAYKKIADSSYLSEKSLCGY